MIRTARLELVPMPAAVAAAVMAGDWAVVEHELGTPFPPEWRDHGWGWLDRQATEGGRDPDVLAWGTRLAFPRQPVGGVDPRPVIAEVGFHGPPTGGWAEIGYQVVGQFRRRGFAEEAVRGLLTWAFGVGVGGVSASIEPGNVASVNLVRKLGFLEGERYEHEALGEMLRFRLTGAGRGAGS